MDSICGEWTGFLRSRLGHPLHYQHLEGAGGPGAYLVTNNQEEALILKSKVPLAEYYFYQQVAPLVEVRVPKLMASGLIPDPWIVLYKEAATLPEERWYDDPVAVRELGHWHQEGKRIGPTIDRVLPSSIWFDYCAELGFSPAVYAFLGAELQEIVARCEKQYRPHLEEIFSSQDWLHGDPNPTNWLVNHRGQLVLTDWARMGRGHVAIDLAILMAGLPTRERCAALSAQYFGSRPDLIEPSCDRWAELILLAKLWTVLDYLRMANEGSLSEIGHGTAVAVRNRLGPWVRQEILGEVQ